MRRSYEIVVKDSPNRLGDWLKVLSLDNDTSLSSKLSNFSKLAMPTLLIWGDKDTITPLWQAEKVKAPRRVAEPIKRPRPHPAN